MTIIRQVLHENKWQGVRTPVTPARVLCRPDCPVCGGVGYVRYDVPVGDPRFGKLAPCPSLPPESSIFDGHGLTAREIASSTWDEIVMRENVSEAVQAIRELLEYGNGMGYLYGGAGLAKTKLLQIACAEWARSGRGVFHFTTQKDILDQMRMAFDDDQPQRKIVETQEKFISFPLLAIDELTTERSTEFKIEQFFHVVNKRHEAGTERGQGFVTLMAGNVSPAQLDFRITDRLSDGRNFILMLTGKSYRPAMERQDLDHDRQSAFETGEQKEIESEIRRAALDTGERAEFENQMKQLTGRLAK